MKYMAGEPVGVGKYKSNAQRKAAHASMAEQGAGKYGKHADYDKDMAEERIQIADDKKKIFQDDKKKRESEGMKMYGKKHKK